jgi:hypothetical protein
MSTVSSIKYERDEASGREVHVYLDLEEPGQVLLEATGFAFDVEVDGAIGISTGYPLSIAISLSDQQARKLNLPGRHFEITGDSAAQIRIKFPMEWARRLELFEPKSR